MDHWLVKRKPDTSAVHTVCIISAPCSATLTHGVSIPSATSTFGACALHEQTEISKSPGSSFALPVYVKHYRNSQVFVCHRLLGRQPRPTGPDKLSQSPARVLSSLLQVH